MSETRRASVRELTGWLRYMAKGDELPLAQRYRLDDSADLLDAMSADLAAAQERIALLEGAGRECADDLEAELRDRYGDEGRMIPMIATRFDRDMEPVRAFRALLSAPTASAGGEG